jgi:hypothetical protein
MPKAKDEVVFELAPKIREVSGTLPSGRTLVIKKGDKRATSDPDEIAMWKAAKGVQVAKAKRASTSSASPGAVGSKEGE